MKAYQVFRGEENKHGFQVYDLVATYFDKERALQQCEQIVAEEQMSGDILQEYESYGGKYKSWNSVGWDIVTIVQLREIEII
jgi:hypothetical protein